MTQSPIKQIEKAKIYDELLEAIDKYNLTIQIYPGKHLTYAISFGQELRVSGDYTTPHEAIKEALEALEQLKQYQNAD